MEGREEESVFCGKRQKLENDMLMDNQTCRSPLSFLLCDISQAGRVLCMIN